MRRAAVLALATVVFAVPAVGGAQTASSPPASQTPAAKPPASHDRLLTPEQEGRQGMLKGVLVQPFRDLGLVESKIPRVLIEAMADPYARVTPGTCEAYAAQIQRLDAALGPDSDAPAVTERPSQMKRGEGQAREASLDAMRGAEQSYIPFDGAIRIVSGADRHDHKVLAAIKAGAMRRAYLKGLGEAQSCGTPASPLHLAHPVAVAAEQEHVAGR
jgi:hypothetical protein